MSLGNPLPAYPTPTPPPSPGPNRDRRTDRQPFSSNRACLLASLRLFYAHHSSYEEWYNFYLRCRCITNRASGLDRVLLLTLCSSVLMKSGNETMLEVRTSSSWLSALRRVPGSGTSSRTLREKRREIGTIGSKENETGKLYPSKRRKTGVDGRQGVD